MGYTVLLTAGAERDLAAIYTYLATSQGSASADHVLEQVLDASASLAALPERGAHPKELLALGIREYRHLFFGPYRLIYRIIGQRVYVTLIADGRRDMQALLERRLLGTD